MRAAICMLSLTSSRILVAVAYSCRRVRLQRLLQHNPRGMVCAAPTDPSIFHALTSMINWTTDPSIFHALTSLNN